MAKTKLNKTKVLNSLFKLEKDITLIYREDKLSTWSDRCKLFGEGYNSLKNYNHRNMLDCEVVIEYDEDDKTQNSVNALRVCDRLDKYNIKYGRWRSGNKSVHIHIFLDIPDTVTDLSTLKRVFMKYFGTLYKDGKTGKRYYEKDSIPEKLLNSYILPNGEVFEYDGSIHDLAKGTVPLIERILPDMQLASKHPIRCEYGLHEKTGKNKALLKASHDDYISLQVIPPQVWSKYNKERARISKMNITKALNKNLDENPLVKDLLNAVKFREDVADGRERLLFFFIHVLKHKMEKDDLIKLLQEWYRYSSGTGLSDIDIRNKVNYHYNRDYNPGMNYLRNLCEEVGLDISKYS